MNTTIPILRQMGHDAVGIDVGPPTPITSSNNIIRLVRSDLFNPFHATRIAWHIASCDILHWIGGRRQSVYTQTLLGIVKSLQKPAIVEFCGSDIRCQTNGPGGDSTDDMTGFIKSHDESLRVQQLYARHGFNAMTFGYELDMYLHHDLFPTTYKTRRCVDIDALSPLYRTGRDIPLIVHCPSRKGVKGSRYVLLAVEELRRQGITFEFRLLTDLKREKLLSIIRTADIVIDQLLIGDHGTLSLEAMALGKPVLCYLCPKVSSSLPADCPIVNVDKSSLSQHMRNLLHDPARRHSLGESGRSYVNTYHDARLVSQLLEDVYRDVISRKRSGRPRF